MGHRSGPEADWASVRGDAGSEQTDSSGASWS
jgi:hypothetical protein